MVEFWLKLEYKRIFLSKLNPREKILGYLMCGENFSGTCNAEINRIKLDV